jgi:hypothetical protein
LSLTVDKISWFKKQIVWIKSKKNLFRFANSLFGDLLILGGWQFKKKAFFKNKKNKKNKKQEKSRFGLKNI